MNIYITGCSGFIGSHLKSHFEKGNHVVEISHLDIYDKPTLLRRFIRLAPPDVIIHASGYGNHSMQSNGYDMIKSNVQDIYTLLEETKNIPYKAFINISTSSIYGKCYLPMHEKQYYLPETMYAATKAAGELVVQQFVRSTSKPVVNIRPFSIYGPGEASFRFIPTIIRAALDHKTCDVWEGEHDWTYIDDFIRGVEVTIDNADKLKGTAVNIGTGESYTNEEVVYHIQKYAPCEYLLLNKRREQDSEVWCADINRLEEFGYSPQFSLDEGIKRTVEYYTDLWKN